MIEKANGDDVAEGCFESYGDHGRDSACNDKSSAAGPVDCNYNMDEDGKVKFQVELWDGSNRVAETGWTAWQQI